MGDIKTEKFTLPEKTVIVRYIKRKKGMASDVSEDHVIAGGMLNGAKKGFMAPLLKNGTIANVLTNTEKEALEEMTQLELSVYKDYWKERIVWLFKDDNYLDLSNPADYISYKILLASKDDIAPSWSERDKKATYQFVITSEDEELVDRKKSFDSKKQAYKLYGKIEDDKDKLISLFKLLSNKPIASTTSLEWIKDKVEDFIDKKPKDFVALFEDSHLETKLLISEATFAKIITKSGNKYSTSDGLELCEAGQVATFDNVVKYLENPKHQDVRNLIEAKLNSNK